MDSATQGLIVEFSKLTKPIKAEGSFRRPSYNHLGENGSPTFGSRYWSGDSLINRM